MSAPFVSFADHAMYLAHSVGNQQAVMQLLWRYHRPVDLDALTRFRHHLEHSPLARLLQPALLPIGRPRWVRSPETSSALTIPTEAMPVETMQAWADAQIELPMDPVQGPGWTFTVQPFRDGSTVVSLVISHCIADGMATAIAVKEAVRGQRRPPAYSHKSAYHPLVSMTHELLRFIKDIPATFGALDQLMRTARNIKTAPSALPVATTGRDQAITFPSVFVRIPTSVWDEKAASLGVTRFTLLAAMTAAFAVALGRIRDHHATLFIPVNRRDKQVDSDANCVSLATLKVPVDDLTENLHEFQRRLQATVQQTRTTPDTLASLLPLVPFVPNRAFVAASQLAFRALADLPVTCSHMGEIPIDALRIDGAAADLFCFRGMDRQVTARSIEERQGVASLATGTIPGYILLNFIAYQPGWVTNSDQLRALVEELLTSYNFKGEFFDA
jgi:hypothetical protein